MLINYLRYFQKIDNMDTYALLAAGLAIVGAIIFILEKIYEANKEYTKGEITKKDFSEKIAFPVFSGILIIVGCIFTYHQSEKAKLLAKSEADSSTLYKKRIENLNLKIQERTDELLKKTELLAELENNQLDTSRRIIRLSQRLLSIQDTLLVYQNETTREIIGSDSCMVVFMPIIDKIFISLVNFSKYPIDNSTVFIQEPQKMWFREVKSSEGYFFEIKHMNGSQYSMGKNYIDNNANLLSFSPIPLDYKQVEIVFTVEIKLRKDVLTQITKITRSGNSNVWATATRVWSQKRNKYIREDVMPQYPKEKDGSIDWLISSSVNKYIPNK